MPQESLQALYDSVSETYDVGTFDTFTQKMQDPTKRRALYGVISNEFDLPEYETFEAKVTTTAPAIVPQDVFIDPDEDLTKEESFRQNIYESVKQQENSVAKNNPYGVNMPRKKSNIERMINLGGGLMAGSQSLLEFEDIERGMMAGEEIIDNLLTVSKNDPAKFYSNYSGLAEDSPEVKSFVKIFNEKNKLTQPKKETNLDRIIKALEYGKENPQHVIKATSAYDPAKALTQNLPKTVMGIPTTEILGDQKQMVFPDGMPVNKKEQEELDKQRKELGLPFKPTEKDFQRDYNKKLFLKEVAKLEKKGLTKRDAYRKASLNMGGTPPSVIDLAMEKSITGAAFRIAGLEQTTMLDEYPPNQLEEIVSGVFSMVMPIDAALFKGGGSLGKIKQVGKAADKAAVLLAKHGKMPLRTARVYMKSIIPRVTGGGGGFAAFDSGRSIVDQIEFTGAVDPIEVAEHAMKGFLTGGSVGFLGGAGSFAGKKLQKAVGAPVSKQATAKETLGFAGEVFGLAEVPALLEGRERTKEERKEDYKNAASMIIGLKLLKKIEPKAGTALRDNVATEIERIVKETGKPLDVVANEVVGRPLRTAMELAMEGKTPEKSVRQQITEYEVAEGARKPVEPGINRAEAVVKEAEAIEQLKRQGFSQVEAEQRYKTVLRDAGVKTEDILRAEAESPTKTNERVQLNQQIERLSDKISELEKANAEQGILDNLQIQIDAKVARLNEMGVGEAEINKALEPKTTPSTKEIDLTKVSEKSLSRQFSKSELAMFLKSKGVEVFSKDSKVSLIRKIKTLSREQYVLESQPKPDIIPIKSALTPKTTPSTKEVQLQMKRRARSEQERLDKTLQERDILNRPFEPDPMREVPLHPADAGKKVVAEIQAIETANDVPKKSIKTLKTNKKKVTGVDINNNPKDYNLKIGDKVVVNKSTSPVTIKKFKRGKNTNIIEVKSDKGIENLTDRNLFTPEKVIKEKVNRSNLKPVSELQGQKRIQGFTFQKELADFDATLKVNEARLKDPSLTEIQRERTKESIQKLKELKRNTQDDARAQGIELQAFMGIPSFRQLRQLFGSEKSRPKTLRDAELDRLYNNAMQRLDKEAPEEGVKIETIPNNLPPKFQSPLSRALNWISSDMVGRVRSMDTETSIEASKKLFKSIDLEKKTYGELTDVLDPALIISGSGKDAKNLSRFVEKTINGETVLMNRMHLGIEGKIQLRGKELEIAERIRDVIEKRGYIFERNNIMQEAPDGTIRPFKVMGRNIAPRIMTPEFYDILNKGKYNQDFKIMVNDFATSTGQPKESITKYFSELSDNVKGVVSPNQSTPTRTTQAEHSRKWKDIPHAIKDSNGNIVPLVEYKPFEYARRLAETGASRIGVAKVFGQEIDNTSIVNQLKEQIASEGGNPIVFHQAIRAVSGTPVEAPVLSVGTGSRVTRAYNAAMNIVKNFTLSGSIFPNIPEPLGNIRKHSGMLPLMKNIFDLTTNKKAIEAMLEKQGAITVDIANISIDPIRPVSSFTRATTEVTRRLFGIKQANEWQELLAGYTYSQNVKRFKAGKGKYKDVLLIEEMIPSLSRKNAELIVSGKAPQDFYDALIRRAPAYLTGGAQRGGEQSRLQHSKYFKALTAFETYAQMKIQSLSRSVSTYGKGTKEAINEGNYKKFVDVNRLMASEILGTAISGSAAQLMLAFVYGGKDNLDIKLKEIQANPLRFAIESYAYSAVGGVIGSIMQSTANGKLSENPWDVFFPINVITEVTDAAMGKGKYTYLEAEERYLEVAKRYFPINKALRTMSVAMGFGNKQTLKDDNAIKAYYRWKFENKYGGGYVTGEIDEEIKNFRVNMKKAYSSLRNGEDETAIDEHVYKALDLTGKDISSARMSILGKKLLTKSKIAPGKPDDVFEERKESLRNQIGEVAYERLLRHDERLEDYAEFWQY